MCNRTWSRPDCIQSRSRAVFSAITDTDHVARRPSRDGGQLRFGELSHLTRSLQRPIDRHGGFDRNTDQFQDSKFSSQTRNDSVMMLPPSAQSSSEKCSRLLKATHSGK